MFMNLIKGDGRRAGSKGQPRNISLEGRFSKGNRARKRVWARGASAGWGGADWGGSGG